MTNVFLQVYSLIVNCVNWITEIISKSGGTKYVIAGFTAYSITRFLIVPALKHGLPGSGMSDSVKAMNKEQVDKAAERMLIRRAKGYD